MRGSSVIVNEDLVSMLSLFNSDFICTSEQKCCTWLKTKLRKVSYEMQHKITFVRQTDRQRAGRQTCTPTGRATHRHGAEQTQWELKSMFTCQSISHEISAQANWIVGWLSVFFCLHFRIFHFRDFKQKSCRYRLASSVGYPVIATCLGFCCFFWKLESRYSIVHQQEDWLSLLFCACPVHACSITCGFIRI